MSPGTGQWGMFEAKDEAVAAALIRTAEDWLREQRMTRALGPISISIWDEPGLLIQGFDEPPTFMMTYNPPWYGDLWEAFGWKKTQDAFAFYGHVDMLDGLNKKLDFVANESIRRFNIKLRNMDRSHFERDVRTFLHLYNVSLPVLRSADPDGLPLKILELTFPSSDSADEA